MGIVSFPRFLSVEIPIFHLQTHCHRYQYHHNVSVFWGWWLENIANKCEKSVFFALGNSVRSWLPHVVDKFIGMKRERKMIHTQSIMLFPSHSHNRLYRLCAPISIPMSSWHTHIHVDDFYTKLHRHNKIEYINFAQVSITYAGFCFRIDWIPLIASNPLH